MRHDERPLQELRMKYRQQFNGYNFSDELFRQMVADGHLVGTYYESTRTLLISEASFVDTMVPITPKSQALFDQTRWPFSATSTNGSQEFIAARDNEQGEQGSQAA